MIKISIDGTTMKEIEKNHLLYFKRSKMKKIDEFINESSGNDSSLYDYLKNNIDKIILEKPEKLNNIINEINSKWEINDEEKKKIKKIFNYSAFSKGNEDWGAYHLAEALNIKVCPYCNRQYTFTINSRKTKIRPSFDHFYSKSQYPYLSLSLYNLIPSCELCNSRLKGNKEFTYEDNIHPYDNEFGDSARFSIRFKDKNQKYDFTALCGGEGDYEIAFCFEDDNAVISKKIKKNIDTFKLEDIYNLHKDHVDNIIKIATVYSEDRIDELFRLYQGTLFNSKKDVIEMIVNNYVEEKNIDKKILGKLTRDICRELGLL